MKLFTVCIPKMVNLPAHSTVCIVALAASNDIYIHTATTKQLLIPVPRHCKHHCLKCPHKWAKFHLNPSQRAQHKRSMLNHNLVSIHYHFIGKAWAQLQYRCTEWGSPKMGRTAYAWDTAPFFHLGECNEACQQGSSQSQEGCGGLGLLCPWTNASHVWTDPQGCQLFMTNWLAICPFWISQLDHDPPAWFPSP